jgi:GNAT superfamily N-acetyltransferase
VPRLTTRPFTPDDLDAAGRLLAARHRALRRVEPMFDERYEDPATARAEVAALLDAGATGAAAVEGDELTGYLLGGHREQASWGPNVWVEPAGHAVRDAETVRDLYAAAAPAWVDQGWEAQYPIVPAYDTALVDAWFRLGFGQQHVHGIREVPGTTPPPPAHLVVRAPRREDVPVLAELDVALPAHQLLAPTFAAGEAFTVDEAVAEWQESFDARGDDGFWHVVVEHDGRVVGAATACSLEKSSGHAGLTRPPNAGFLGYASVLPDARGLGAGRALGEAVLGWVRDAGFTSAVSDWRATNLLSSRAWTALGFRPSFYRLHRRIGY